MRQKIVKALEQAKNGPKDQKDWANQNVGLGEIAPGNYSSRLSETQKSKLEQIYQKLKRLKSCLQLSLDTALIDLGTSTSLEIQWAVSKSQVVIELSLYGPLATVFEYGEIPESALQHIDKCLRANDLTRLSDEEKEQLENQGVYHELF